MLNLRKERIMYSGGLICDRSHLYLELGYSSLLRHRDASLRREQMLVE